MRFRIRFAQQIVGLFIVVGLAAALVVVVLMGANQRWFARNYTYTSRFNSAKGLSVGMAVTFKGFEIGKVTDVELTEENFVEMRFYVQDTYLDKVTEDSVLQLTSSPIGIGGGLVFHQGVHSTPPLPEGSLIPAWDSEEGRRLRSQGRVAVTGEEDAVAQLLSNVNNVLLTVDATLATVQGALDGTSPGPVADVVVGVDELVTSLERSTTRIADSFSTSIVEVQRSISDSLTRIDLVMTNVEQTTAALADPTGLVPTLLDPQGSVATLLDDDNVLFDSIQALLESLEASVAELASIVEYLDETTPQVASLLEEGRRTLDTSQDVLEGIKNNPLIRRGVPPAPDQQTTFQSIRDEEF